MSVEELDYDLIKQWLQPGELREIADEFGLTTDAAHKILNRRNKKRFKTLSFIKRCHQRAVQHINEHLAMKEQENLLKQKIAAL